MPKQITFKKQGDGKDSWIIRYLNDNGKDKRPPEIVYEDPTDETLKNVKLTDYQLAKLMELLGEK